MSGLDVLTFFNSAIGVLVRGRGILRMPAHLHEEWNSPTEKQIRQAYGVLATYGTKVLLNDAWMLLLRIEADILPSDDKTLLAFKSACSSEFTMTAVAGAIIAQVAITALALPFTLRVHWVVQAGYVISLISGCLSVYAACIAQRIMGNLTQTEEVRDWLSRSRLDNIPNEAVDATYERSLYQPEILEIIVRDNPELIDTLLTPRERERYRGSLYAAMLITAPSAMLNYSLGTFLTGLGAYLGFTWIWGLQEEERYGGDRSVFIVFMVFAMLYLFLYAVPLQMKKMESVPIRQKRRLAYTIEERRRGTFTTGKRRKAEGKLEDHLEPREERVDDRGDV